MGKATIYILDDDVSVGKSLTLLLSLYGYKTHVFTMASDFLSFSISKNPSCLILDLRLPGMDGFRLQEIMIAKNLTVPIIFISGYGDIPSSVKAVLAGAIDFLPKPFINEDLIKSVKRAILKSKEQIKEVDYIHKIKKRLESLSPREREVFYFVTDGLLNKQIASRRKISLQTVKVHRSRVMRKMQARTVTELIQFARQLVPKTL